MESSGVSQKSIDVYTDSQMMTPRELTNNLLRKSPTSSVVEGPPIFMKTIAVGPLDDVASWVTWGTIVAIDRIWHCGCFEIARCVLIAAALGMENGEACLYSWDIGFRSAMSCDHFGRWVRIVSWNCRIHKPCNYA